MFDLTRLQGVNLDLFIKIMTLVFIGLYAIFCFMLATKIRSFNKILFLPPNSGGTMMQKIALIYSFCIVVLFILALLVL